MDEVLSCKRDGCCEPVAPSAPGAKKKKLYCSNACKTASCRLVARKRRADDDGCEELSISEKKSKTQKVKASVTKKQENAQKATRVERHIVTDVDGVTTAKEIETSVTNTHAVSEKVSLGFATIDEEIRTLTSKRPLSIVCQTPEINNWLLQAEANRTAFAKRHPEWVPIPVTNDVGIATEMITRKQEVLCDVQWVTIFETGYFPVKMLTGRLMQTVSDDIRATAYQDVIEDVAKHEEAKILCKRAEYAKLLGELLETRNKWNDYIKFVDASTTVTPIGVVESCVNVSIEQEFNGNDQLTGREITHESFSDKITVRVEVPKLSLDFEVQYIVQKGRISSLPRLPLALLLLLPPKPPTPPKAAVTEESLLKAVRDAKKKWYTPIEQFQQPPRGLSSALIPYNPPRFQKNELKEMWEFLEEELDAQDGAPLEVGWATILKDYYSPVKLLTGTLSSDFIEDEEETPQAARRYRRAMVATSISRVIVR